VRAAADRRAEPRDDRLAARLQVVEPVRVVLGPPEEVEVGLEAIARDAITALEHDDALAGLGEAERGDRASETRSDHDHIRVKTHVRIIQ
jgi:hypothetical protein